MTDFLEGTKADLDAAEHRAVTRIVNIFQGKRRMDVQRDAHQIVQDIVDALMAERFMS